MTTSGRTPRPPRSPTPARSTGTPGSNTSGSTQNLAPDLARHSAAVTGLASLPPAGGAATLQVGKVDLISLGSPLNTGLSAVLGSDSDATLNTALGSFPETAGAATVSFTMPAAGSYALVMTAAPSGTVVTIPILVVAASPTSSSAPVLPPVSSSSTSRNVLSSTGISPAVSTGATGVAAALILLGVVVLVLARRRRQNGHDN